MYEASLIDEVLVSEEEILNKCRELGAVLTKEYETEPENLLVVGLLRGAVPFMSELVKRIDLPIVYDFMAASSYSGTESLGDIKILLDLHSSIVGKDVLLVEDIVDTGITVMRVKELLYNKGARSVKVVALLDKPERREVDVKADWVGFTIPNKFVVGFGLDYDQLYRNIPYIAVLKPEVYTH
ncbi:MAG: hypoxanthine phosphoribosyltransferase [Erysipelotrichales bacterium]|nr:hypoxanthine phosphoribosyltransferase [Erysipelotrichales bacterium]